MANIDIEAIKRKLLENPLSQTNENLNTLNSLMGDMHKNSEKGDMTLENLVQSSMMKSWQKSQNTATSDLAHGAKVLTQTVIEAPAQAAIGRSLVNVSETTEQSLILRLPKLALASETTRKAKAKSTGERNAFLTMTPNDEIEASDEYDDNYLEDSPWNVTQREIAAISAAHDIKETIKILKFYDDQIANSASGSLATANSPNNLTYDDIVDLWESLGDFDGKVIAVSKKGMAELMKSNDFKDQTFFGDGDASKTGLVGRNILGFDIMMSTLVSSTKAYAIDTAAAGQYVIRRNKVLKTFQPSINSEMVQVSSRVDLKLGRNKTFEILDWST